jgi:REP element-mobilizing transposase RayT
VKRPYREIVIAHHLVWTAYGWWLPNDPRGSTSKTIASDVIAELGQLHHGRRRIQPAGRVIREFYDRAKQVLKFALLTLTPEEIRIVSESFAALTDGHPYTCYACAIMPDHVHVVIRKHRNAAEQMIQDLQDASRLHLQKSGRRAGHPVWGGPGWKVFLRRPDEVRRTVRYVSDNPVKWRLPRQDWDFVQDYDDWPLHKRNR